MNLKRYPQNAGKGPTQIVDFYINPKAGQQTGGLYYEMEKRRKTARELRKTMCNNSRRT